MFANIQVKISFYTLENDWKQSFVQITAFPHSL